MKALDLLKLDRDTCQILNNDASIITQYDEAIKELEVIRDNIKTSMEEIEWALAKPEYASNYLNNALRYLKERV